MSQDLSILEKWALERYRKCDERIACDDEPLIDLRACHSQINQVERRTIRNAAIAGALSGLSGAIAAYFADPLMPSGEPSLTEQLPYLAIVFSVTLVATALEIAYLYWDGLYAAVRINRIAQRCELNCQTQERTMDLILVRSALELSEPVEPLFGINPLSRKSKLRVFLKTIAYKAKIAVTNFLLKALLKRIFGRAASRYFVELVAVPVFALWNMLITRWIMAETRTRALGQAIVESIYPQILKDLSSMSRHGQYTCFLALGEAVHSSGEFHPNVVLFLEKFTAETDLCENELVKKDFHESLKKCSKEEQRTVLDVLTVACCLNGKLTRA
ncbi:MAG: hypothetical protein VXZ35_09790, partial [Pseudomonadota bacterium]|nr:hypothetical protein [Pseudomonadota bacterium]